MLLASAALIGGIILLVLSANKFVDGAAATARHFGLPPLLIGILVIGYIYAIKRNAFDWNS